MLRAENPADNIEQAVLDAIAEDAMQAAFALIAVRLKIATGLHVYGDIDPLHSQVIANDFRGYVRTMAENIAVDQPVEKLVATFDVTQLTAEERDQLGFYISVQAEGGNEGEYPSVEAPEIVIVTQ